MKEWMAYMRRMIMEPQPIVQNREGRVIQLEEMFEGAGPLVRRGFNVVDLNGWDVDGLARRRAPAGAEAEAWKGERCE